MKALIIYNDFTSAAKANTALQRSAQHADGGVQWDVRPWRVDMLKFPPTAAEALAEARDAQLIVFACNRAQPFPFWLNDWLEEWSACRQTKDAALAVIGLRNGDVFAMPTAYKLLQFAKRHRLSFIIGESASAKSGAKLSSRSISKGMALPPLAQPSLSKAPIYESHRHWGINE